MTLEAFENDVEWHRCEWEFRNRLSLHDVATDDGVEDSMEEEEPEHTVSKTMVVFISTGVLYCLICLMYYFHLG